VSELPEVTQAAQTLALLHQINAQVIRNTVQLEVIEKNQRQNVSRAEFEPVKRLVFGAVALILTSIVGALIFLVVG
jgi:hypothetical protein